MGLRVYWELCGKYGLKRSEKWYEEVPDPVRTSADGRVEIRWDQKIVTQRQLSIAGRMFLRLIMQVGDGH